MEAIVQIPPFNPNAFFEARRDLRAREWFLHHLPWNVAPHRQARIAEVLNVVLPQILNYKPPVTEDMVGTFKRLHELRIEPYISLEACSEKLSDLYRQHLAVSQQVANFWLHRNEHIPVLALNAEGKRVLVNAEMSKWVFRIIKEDFNDIAQQATVTLARETMIRSLQPFLNGREEGTELRTAALAAAANVINMEAENDDVLQFVNTVYERALNHAKQQVRAFTDLTGGQPANLDIYRQEINDIADQTQQLANQLIHSLCCGSDVDYSSIDTFTDLYENVFCQYNEVAAFNRELMMMQFNYDSTRFYDDQLEQVQTTCTDRFRGIAIAGGITVGLGWLASKGWLGLVAGVLVSVVVNTFAIHMFRRLLTDK